MENNNLINREQVEVMALFGYEMTPCQPLSFKRRGERDEVEITELLKTQIRFAGATAIHIFEVLVGHEHYRLEFNSIKLIWQLSKI